MMEYIPMKSIVDSLAAISKPVMERDHVLQLLGGLGPEYNSLVASRIQILMHNFLVEIIVVKLISIPVVIQEDEATTSASHSDNSTESLVTQSIFDAIVFDINYQGQDIDPK
ncbi:hypothetical protein CK203_075836 [Vitis vinifera]|uniref:Uncharacterized protein n=1 Tax=Vitis vinifera TaxID=29760 RepID=A0A438F7A8_VITVI|nr:hypothetical protein CK203_075836 [Vitis vinifera]